MEYNSISRQKGGHCMPKIPTVNTGGVEVSRLMTGSNPIRGMSHVNQEMNQEMKEYFTMENSVKYLQDAAAAGIDGCVFRTDEYTMRVIYEFRQRGGEVKWFAQQASEVIFENNVRSAKNYGANGFFIMGNTTDGLFAQKNYEEIERRLKVIRDSGMLVGLGTHNPEVLYYSQDHNWDVDFYFASAYNTTRHIAERMAQGGPGFGGPPPAGAGGRPPGPPREQFNYPITDPPLMYEAVRYVDKPCIVFKVMGATRRCETQQDVQDAFDLAFASIKPTDAVAVGFWPKAMPDQFELDAQYVINAIEKAEKK